MPESVPVAEPVENNRDVSPRERVLLQVVGETTKAVRTEGAIGLRALADLTKERLRSQSDVVRNAVLEVEDLGKAIKQAAIAAASDAAAEAIREGVAQALASLDLDRLKSEILAELRLWLSQAEARLLAALQGELARRRARSLTITHDDGSTSTVTEH